MRNDDRTADDQPDVERVVQLRVRDTKLHALPEVVGDAIVAAQNERSHQTDQLFGFLRKGTLVVRSGIEVEETVDAQVPGLQNLFIHLAPELVELMDAVNLVGHGPVP